MLTFAMSNFKMAKCFSKIRARLVGEDAIKIADDCIQLGFRFCET